MSDENVKEQVADIAPIQGQTAVSEDTPQSRKLFTRADVVRGVEVKVALPKLYPDYEPWAFKLRLKMTSDAEERRQVYLALNPTEQTLKETDQNLDELCDLLTALPKGFGDLKDNGQGPGSSFRDYVETASAEQRPILDTIVRGAVTLYWRNTSPQEFRS